jgi:acylphosphatase
VKTRSTVIVKGRVQGVSFRHYTARAASRHNVTGWVMNLPDGSVEACFEGEEDDVREMVSWCHSGPDLAQVDEVIEKKGAYTGEFSGFNIRYSHD